MPSVLEEARIAAPLDDGRAVVDRHRPVVQDGVVRVAPVVGGAAAVLHRADELPGVQCGGRVDLVPQSRLPVRQIVDCACFFFRAVDDRKSPVVRDRVVLRVGQRMPGEVYGDDGAGGNDDVFVRVRKERDRCVGIPCFHGCLDRPVHGFVLCSVV